MNPWNLWNPWFTFGSSVLGDVDVILLVSCCAEEERRALEQLWAKWKTTKL